MSCSLKPLLLIFSLVVALTQAFLNNDGKGMPVSSSSRMAFTTRQQQQQLWATPNEKPTSSSSNGGDTVLIMKELKQRINELTNPYHELFANLKNGREERPEHVHIILFKPDTEEQGLHSIEYPKGSGSNFVLAFASEQACDKFAASLKAQNFDFMAPKQFELEDLESLCDALGVFVQVVPEGTEIVPPTQSVQNLGQHSPHLKEEKSHLEYVFDMFEMEAAEELGLLAPEPGTWE